MRVNPSSSARAPLGSNRAKAWNPPMLVLLQGDVAEFLPACQHLIQESDWWFAPVFFLFFFLVRSSKGPGVGLVTQQWCAQAISKVEKQINNNPLVEISFWALWFQVVLSTCCWTEKVCSATALARWGQQEHILGHSTPLPLRAGGCGIHPCVDAATVSYPLGKHCHVGLVTLQPSNPV